MLMEGNIANLYTVLLAGFHVRPNSLWMKVLYSLPKFGRYQAG